jgi:hypothetical protein
VIWANRSKKSGDTMSEFEKVSSDEFDAALEASPSSQFFKKIYRN